MQKVKINMSIAEEELLSQLKKEIKEEEDGLKSLNEDEKQRKNKDIIAMIHYYIDMSNKVEDRRSHIRTFTLQMLAIWVAALMILIGLYLNKDININIILFVSALAVFIGQIITNLFSIVIYELQSRLRYPFLWKEAEEYGNKWKWFYYGSQPIQRISTKVICQSHAFNETVGPYIEEFRDFMHNYQKEDLDSQIIDNIQQLHLLRVHNYFKNKFFLKLTNIQMWSIYLIPITLVIGIVVGIILD